MDFRFGQTEDYTSLPVQVCSGMKSTGSTHTHTCIFEIKQVSTSLDLLVFFAKAQDFYLQKKVCKITK